LDSQLVVVDYRKCVGCGSCEMICSLVHEGICAPSLSRIRVVRYERLGWNVPVTCAMCEKPVCASVCPVGAVVRNRETGLVLIEAGRCIGCRQCVQACPFGHAGFNPVQGVAFKCDLCEGDPQCVKFCWTGALSFVPLETAVGVRRRESAQKIISE